MLIPQPKNIFRGNLGQKEREQCEKDGIPNWYDWNCQNWGTKWGERDLEIEEGFISFSTPWGPPSDALLDKFMEIFPNLTFSYEEEQGWGGEVEFVNGEMVSQKEWDIPDFDLIDEDHEDYQNLTSKHQDILTFLDREIYYCDGHQVVNGEYLNEGYYLDYCDFSGNEYQTLEELLDELESEAKKSKLLVEKFDKKRDEIVEFISKQEVGDASSEWDYISKALKDSEFEEFDNYKYKNLLRENFKHLKFESDLPF